MSIGIAAWRGVDMKFVQTRPYWAHCPDLHQMICDALNEPVKRRGKQRFQLTPEQSGVCVDCHQQADHLSQTGRCPACSKRLNEEALAKGRAVQQQKRTH